MQRGHVVRVLKDKAKDEGTFGMMVVAPAVQWYSQIGQDRWVCENVFKHRTNGYFVDVGAYDGKDLSNTYVLEHHYGWRGLCVEPMSDSFAKLVACRPKSINVPVAAYDKDFQVLEFQCHGILSGASDHVDHAKGNIVHVPTMTLTSLFKLYDAPKQMDFLSIDAEGSDFHVLKGIDWDTYSFKAIAVEHNYVEPIRSNMQTFLASKGYSLATSLAWDDIYVHAPEITTKTTLSTAATTAVTAAATATTTASTAVTAATTAADTEVMNPGVVVGSRDVRVVRPIVGGLGDCVLACLMYATAGKLMGADLVHCIWSGSCDLNQVQKHVKFPGNLVFWSNAALVKMKDIPELKQKDILVESLLPSQGWWRFHKVPGLNAAELNQQAFEKVYRELAAQLTVEHPAILPKSPYAVLHVRGGDRRDDSKEFISSTQHTLAQLKKHCGIQRWVLVTDDPIFAKTIAPSDICVPATVDDVIKDMKMLLNAAVIVQHAPNGWSAFSHMAACIRQIPVINTCPFERWNYMMHLIKANIMPPSFFQSHQVSQLIHTIQHIQWN
jgi:FkbM family methyltransferase